MIDTDAKRADYYFRKEQWTRYAIDERTKELFERARRQIDLRIAHYPKSMRGAYQLYVEQLWRDMCSEDLRRQELIGVQQHYLRLAHAYKGDR
jgi:hypothetical protein